jgi:hypothetical protein
MPTGPLFYGIVAGATLIVSALCLLMFVRRPSALIRRARFYSAGIGIGIFLIVAVLHKMKENRDAMMNLVETGQVHVVEGLVENFHPMAQAGHDMERFTVQGENFAYSDYVITGGFNNASSHGGPMKSGLPVRITYVDGNAGRVIVKLEIGHPAEPSS